MGKGTVLLIDDEKDILEMVRYSLEKEGFDAIMASDGQSGLDIANRHKPDIIILDLMMPGLDGVEVCKRLRSNAATRAIPIIMLTARAAETDRIVGLEMGADDYITKPFSPRELVARVKAVLRRTRPAEEPPQIIRQGDIVIDLSRHEVTCLGKPVSLTATEFKILQTLASRPGRVFGRDEIIDAAIGDDNNVFDRTIDVHVTAIRKKLGKQGDTIETVRGFGYKFRETRE
jgi:DNA-binding response OmpR family regulator